MKMQVRSGVLALLVLAMAASGASARLVNWEKDSDLELAMKYDSEYNGGNRDTASQSLAERHYLAYLQKCADKAQRAKVYSQLGALFATNWDEERGEKPDYGKAVEYFKAALIEEPDRIGRETIRARLCMLTPLSSKEERLQIRIANYAWMRENFTAEKIRELWLPDAPGQEPSDAELGAMAKLCSSVEEAEAFNLASEACYSNDPAGNVRRVEEMFPGTSAEANCRERLASLASQAIMESKANLARVLSDGLDEIDSGASGAASTDTTVAARKAETEARVPEAGQGAHWPVYMTAVLLGAIIVAGAAVAVCRRRRRDGA